VVSIAGGEHLAGEARTRARDLGSLWERHWKIEEKTAISPQHYAWTEVEWRWRWALRGGSYLPANNSGDENKTESEKGKEKGTHGFPSCPFSKLLQTRTEQGTRLRPKPCGPHGCTISPGLPLKDESLWRDTRAPKERPNALAPLSSMLLKNIY